MLNEYDVEKIAKVFEEKGIGIVLIHGYPEEDAMTVKCFSTIKNNKEVTNILNKISSNLSLFPATKKSNISELVVESPDKGLCEAAEWASSVLNKEPQMILAAIGEDMFSAYASGSVPYLTYLAVRIVSMIYQDNDFDVLEDFPPNLN